jgi:hypothetical protein
MNSFDGKPPNFSRLVENVRTKWQENEWSTIQGDLMHVSASCLHTTSHWCFGWGGETSVEITYRILHKKPCNDRGCNICETHVTNG